MVEQNKYLEELISQGTLEKIAQELGLEEVPEIHYAQKDNAVMSAECFRKTIKGIVVKTTSIYLIIVNTYELERIQDRFGKMACSETIKYDVTELLLRHELRHVHQHETEMLVGMRVDDITDAPGIPHGRLPQEMDANDWMAKSCPERMKALALRLKWEQENHPKDIGDYYALPIWRVYNPIIAYRFEGNQLLEEPPISEKDSIDDYDIIDAILV